MRRQNESFGELLFKAPWWISAAIGVLAFAALRWGVPAWAGSDNLRQTFAKGIAPLAPLPLIFFGILAAGSFWFGKHRRRLVDQQTSLESLRATPWKQFELLVAEAFRRRIRLDDRRTRRRNHHRHVEEIHARRAGFCRRQTHPSD